MSSLLYCKRPNLLSGYWRNIVHPATRLRILLFNAQNSLSSLEAVEGFDERKHKGHRNSFVVSFLVNSCGLSLESAERKCRGVTFDSPEKPDRVLKLLKNHGFTKEQISKVVKCRPNILLANAERNLLPKLLFLHSIGLSTEDTSKLISSCPMVLARSLNDALIPCCDFLRSVLTRDEFVVKSLKRSPWLLLAHVQRDLAPKVSILRGIGVPEAHIELLFQRAPRILSSATNRFKAIVKKVSDLGFDHSKGNFILGIIMMLQLRESTWKDKVDAYKRWGWSEQDFSSVFKKFPRFMSFSVKKITSRMDFFVNTMGLQPLDITRSPIVLGISLEKTIVPRCMVISVLVSAGVLKKEDVNYFRMLAISRNLFMDRFVIKYQKDIPQLLSIIEGKTAPRELGFVSSGK